MNHPLVDEINRVRADHGLSLLRWSRLLSISARLWSRHLARRGVPFAHDPKGIHADRRFRRLGEVLEWHTGERGPGEIVAAWMGSAPHREILLGRSWRRMGGGRWSRGDRTYVTGHFGRR